MDDCFNQWMILKDEVKNCHGCYLSSKVRFEGRGNRNARIMIVGDIPAPEDESSGKLFSGNTGKYIEGLLKLIDIDPNDVYITALVNCVPKKAEPPKSDAYERCIFCLRKQFLLVKPEIVICLGSIAAKRLISQNFKLNSEHGKLTAKGKVMFMGTYHPNAVFYNKNARDDLLSDFLKIKEFCDTYPPYRETGN